MTKSPIDKLKYDSHSAARVLVEAAQDDNVVDLVADYIYRTAKEEESLCARVAELEAAIQAWNDTIGFDEHIEAVRVLQGLAK